jgi:hypothetical protein
MLIRTALRGLRCNGLLDPVFSGRGVKENPMPPIEESLRLYRFELDYVDSDVAELFRVYADGLLAGDRPIGEAAAMQTVRYLKQVVINLQSLPDLISELRTIEEQRLPRQRSQQ